MYPVIKRIGLSLVQTLCPSDDDMNLTFTFTFTQRDCSAALYLLTDFESRLTTNQIKVSICPTLTAKYQKKNRHSSNVALNNARGLTSKLSVMSGVTLVGLAS